MTSLKFLSFFFTCIYFITRSRLFSAPRIFSPAPLYAVCLLMENAVQRFLEKKFFSFPKLEEEEEEEGEVCSVEWPVVTERERNQQGFIRVFIQGGLVHGSITSCFLVNY